MLSMKKRKQHASKEEIEDGIIISSSGSSMNRSVPNSSLFPKDLIFDIYSRVPAKDVARSRCVSKEWNSILTCQDFTDIFLEMSPTRPHLLFTYENEGKWSLFSIPQCVISDSTTLVVIDDHMHIDRDYSGRFCHPTNGLLCTKDEWSTTRKKNGRMVIYNPSIRTLKMLPQVKTFRKNVMTFFGYDPIEKLHKVLCMTACEKPYVFKVEQHQVLTLGKGEKWRMIECSMAHYPEEMYNEICINGVIYYIARGSLLKKDTIIVCFDVRSEKLNFIVDEAFGGMKYHLTLINYKEKLGVLHPTSSGFMDGGSTNIELWVMDDLEKHEWSRHVHILPPLWRELIAETEVIVAGMDAGTGEIVFSPFFLSTPFYIYYYNIERNSIKRVEIQGLGHATKRFQNIYTFVNHIENVKFIM